MTKKPYINKNLNHSLIMGKKVLKEENIDTEITNDMIGDMLSENNEETIIDGDDTLDIEGGFDDTSMNPDEDNDEISEDDASEEIEIESCENNEELENSENQETSKEEIKKTQTELKQPQKLDRGFNFSWNGISYN